MEVFWHAIILSLFTGSTALAGSILAYVENLKPDWISSESRHGIMALGGGALLAAVTFVLIPEGIEMQPKWLSISTFLMGASAFMVLDRYLTEHGTAVSQLIALLLDFIPETIVLGAIISTKYRQAVFSAIIIAVQNFPEGFNAYREIRCKGDDGLLKKHIFGIMVIIMLSGPLFTMIGFYMFNDNSVTLGALMTFCAGGIFYLVFRDIAPQARVEKHWLPSFGAVLGFTIGMIGYLLV